MQKQIAAELGISRCTVYTELKCDPEIDEQPGKEILDKNFRPAYSAERGGTAYQRNLQNRGRRPKREILRACFDDFDFDKVAVYGVCIRQTNYTRTAQGAVLVNCFLMADGLYHEFFSSSSIFSASAGSIL